MVHMKKIYYYDFLPTKKDEMIMQATASTIIPQEVPRTLIEIRDDGPNPGMMPPPPPLQTPAMHEPFRVRKRVDNQEVKTGKIHLTHHPLFDYIFRQASLENANGVVTGIRVNIKVIDGTDEIAPRLYEQYNYLEKGLEDEYVIGLNPDFVKFRALKTGDEVGIVFDAKTSIFYFKIFN